MGITDEVLDEISRNPAGVLADVLSEMGLTRQVVAQDLRPVTTAQKFIGRAVCVSGPDDLEVRLLPGPLPTMFDVDAHVRKDSVVVVDTGGHSHGAVIGGL